VQVASQSPLAGRAEGIEIRVRDNGVGILPEYRDELYQPFFN